MKNLQRIFAKVKVLSCEPKMERDSNRQAMDRDGNTLWAIDIEEKVFNEKHNIETVAVGTYKSIEELTLGDHVVELKVTNMGEGSGTFISVKSFYTILRSVDMKAAIGDIYAFDGVIPPSKRKAMKAATATH